MGPVIGLPLCLETLLPRSATRLIFWCNIFQSGLGAVTQRNLFEILLDQPEFRLYLLYANWFGTKRTSVWLQINRKMVNTIRFHSELARFRKDFSVCRRSGVSCCNILFWGGRAVIEDDRAMWWNVVCLLFCFEIYFQFNIIVFCIYCIINSFLYLLFCKVEICTNAIQ